MAPLLLQYRIFVGYILNLFLQGKLDVLTLSKKATAFQKKFMYVKHIVKNECLEISPSLYDFGKENTKYITINTLLSEGYF